MVGGTGQAWFVAGTGNDTLTSSAGLNEFIFLAGSSSRTDIINNFSGADSIGLFGYGSSAAASAVAAAVVTTSGTTLTLSDNTTVELAGFTNLSQLQNVFSV